MTLPSFDFAAGLSAPPAAPGAFAFDPWAKEAPKPAGGAAVLTTRSAKTRMVHQQQTARCAEQLGRLPSEGETLHVVHSGPGFFLWHLVPAVLQLANGARIRSLRITSLSFNTAFARQMIDLMDADRILRSAILLSVHFRADFPEAYNGLAAELARRGCQIGADLNHSKTATIHLSSGLRLVIENSSNCRSCASREQSTLSASRRLHDWHADWIDKAITAAQEAGR